MHGNGPDAKLLIVLESTTIEIYFDVIFSATPNLFSGCLTTYCKSGDGKYTAKITFVDGDFSASFAYENTGYSRFSSS